MVMFALVYLLLLTFFLNITSDSQAGLLNAFYYFHPEPLDLAISQYNLVQLDLLVCFNPGKSVVNSKSVVFFFG